MPGRAIGVHVRERWMAADHALQRFIICGDVVVTGGTATTVATLKLALPSYDAARVHGYALSTLSAAAVARGVFFMTLSRRRRLVGMPAGRADVFPAGALALTGFLEKLGADSAVVCAQGVRYGVAYRYFEDENR